MQKARILQAVVLMMIVGLAASCAASKEYTSKLFGPRVEAAKDSSLMVIKFLELDKLNPEEDGWVSTDILTKDATTETGSMPIVADVKKKSAAAKDSSSSETKTLPVVAATKKPPVTEEQVARNTTTQNGTRNKTTREK